MLRSTYQKTEVTPEVSCTTSDSDLPPGWTSHIAPTGHTYYYNTETKKSTYTRPVVEVIPAAIPSFASGEYAGGFSGAFFAPAPISQSFARHSRHPSQSDRRSEPKDRPKHRYHIPGCKPWLLVQTKLGRRFVHNTKTGESFWKTPEDVVKGVFEFERRERERKERRERGEPSEDEPDSEEERQKKELEDMEQDNASEYTEVTDDEEEDNEIEEDGPSKRQRVDEDADDRPVEFDEEDLAYELEGMEGFQDHDEDPLSGEDCKLLFFDLLEDTKINPYSTWEKVIEDGRLVDDPRYTALPNMKSRRSAWNDWAGVRMQESKEAREKQVKTDPKIPYFAFLEDKASTKLYWPEFKRKFKKEDIMKTSRLADKDREKWYREYIKRLQLPPNTLKSDFTALLKSLPLSVLNRDTPINNLPSALQADMRYISLQPSIREPLVETYISTLASTPSSAMIPVEDHKLLDRQRREKALAERERKIEAEKHRHHKDLRFGQARLRKGQRELERAMHVGRGGLSSQLREMEPE